MGELAIGWKISPSSLYFFRRDGFAAREHHTSILSNFHVRYGIQPLR